MSHEDSTANTRTVFYLEAKVENQHFYLTLFPGLNAARI